MSKNNFFKEVYEVVKLIPYGRVSTYGDIAEYLGTRSSARMVGWAMNASIGQEDIPAHRVVNRNGFLTGKNHFPEPDEMERLLQSEGIKVEKDKIVEFDKLIWIPRNELL